MIEQVVALCKELGVGEEQETLLLPLAEAACQQLHDRLRRGVTEEDCSHVFPLAAAMLVLDSLEGLTGESGVTSFTAGEVTIRKEGRTSMRAQAMQLMSPWLGKDGFAFMGVLG